MSRVIARRWAVEAMCMTKSACEP